MKDSRAVEEFLAMKNFVTFEMSQEMKDLIVADEKIDHDITTPIDLDALGGKQLGSRN